MGVRIRLARFGRTHAPVYRIFVADSRSPRDGKHIEVVGTYDPLPRMAHTSLCRARAHGTLLDVRFKQPPSTALHPRSAEEAADGLQRRVRQVGIDGANG